MTIYSCKYTELNPADLVGDYLAKRKALQDIQLDSYSSNDAEIMAEVVRRKAALEVEAALKGIFTGRSV